jgi:hypothetical protein
VFASYSRVVSCFCLLGFVLMRFTAGSMFHVDKDRRMPLWAITCLFVGELKDGCVCCMPDGVNCKQLASLRWTSTRSSFLRSMKRCQIWVNERHLSCRNSSSFSSSRLFRIVGMCVEDDE